MGTLRGAKEHCIDPSWKFDTECPLVQRKTTQDRVIFQAALLPHYGTSLGRMVLTAEYCENF